MKITALRDEVIVRKIVKEETKGGIVIPDTINKGVRAEVVAICKNIIRHNKEVSPEVEEGDIVVFPQGTGQLIDIGDEKLIMVKHEDILGKLS